MKKQLIFTILLCSCAFFAFAQEKKNDNPPKTEQTQRVYRVFVNNETVPESIQARNDSLAKRGVRSRSALLASLGVAIASSYANMLIQKTVNASSNMMDVLVKSISSLIHKDRNDREAWLKAAKLHSTFERKLATQISIDDFYYEPSTSGALDPMNMKFNGFGCKCYLMPTMPEEKNQKTSKKKDKTDDATQEQENGRSADEFIEFYVSCKLRQDSIGYNHIANHSKFYVDVDQLVFDTRHSSLPNDSISGKPTRKFNFNGRKDLTFNLNVKVFSSWVNEAIMLIDNQQIGEFNIVAHIDSNDLDDNGIFVYDGNRNDGKVSVSGDCFLVPRSYTGTADAPSWGTGQYRLEMTVSETCRVNEDWYKLPPKTKAKSKADTVAPKKSNKPAKVKWDKSKWKPEWQEMQAYRKQPSTWNCLWRSITTAYIGNDWVQELVSPLTTTVVAQEKVELNKLLNFSDENSGKQGGNAPNSSTSPMPTNSGQGH